MNKKIITIISILTVVLVAVAYWFFNKPKEIIKGNYSKNYDLSLILDKFKNDDYENKFIEYQDKIEKATKDYREGGYLEKDRPLADFFIEKARYAKYLGKTDWAIEILNNIFDYYDNSSVAWNNLAKLYESKKEYIKANEYYQKMVDVFSEKQFWSVYYYMTENSLILGNKEKAREYYNKYKAGGGYSESIEEILAK